MKINYTIITLALLSLTACQHRTGSAAQPVQSADIVFSDSLGHTIAKSELTTATGEFNYEVMGNQNISNEAKLLHDEARALGQAGKYDLSIAKLQQAMKAQPDWAYPVYDLAYTYLLKGDNENALKYYEKTDQMKPKGFFTAKTAVYALRGEREGRFPKGTYISYLQIEWAGEDADKLRIAKAIMQQVPTFAPAWKEIAALSDDPQERLASIDAGLLQSPDAETKGILLLNRAAILHSQGKKAEAQKILGDYIFSPDATLGNIELAKYTLKSISAN